MEHFRADYCRLWVAVDGTGWLRIAHDGAQLRVTVARSGVMQASQRPTTWHPRTPGEEASESALKRLDWLSAELGAPNLGPTYRLYVAAENTDTGRYGGKQWRPVLPDDPIEGIRLFPEPGASFYEAVLGAWDDYVEDINAGIAWVYPLSTWRPATPSESAEAPKELR
jgi:hypothetical protein